MDPSRLLIMLVIGAVAAALFAAGGPAPDTASAQVVGENSCEGANACLGNTGDIGENSCNGGSACERLTDGVGDNSCNGNLACNELTGSVGDNSCNINFACNELTGSVGDYSCNGGFTCSRFTGSVDHCELNRPQVPECISVTLTKTANGAAEVDVPEAGASVSYAVTVTNISGATATIAGLNDSETGELLGSSDCAAGPIELEADGELVCTYDVEVTGEQGTSLENTVTAAGTGSVLLPEHAERTEVPIDLEASATVHFTDAPPQITVTKTVNGADEVSVPETGATVEYAVTVTNDGAEDVFIDALDDTEAGDLLADGACEADVPDSLAPNATFECVYERFVQGDAGTSLANTVTAAVSDDEPTTALMPTAGGGRLGAFVPIALQVESDVEESASATVHFTDVEPGISVTRHRTWRASRRQAAT